MAVAEIISTLARGVQPSFLKYILNNDITNQAEIISTLAPQGQEGFLKYILNNITNQRLRLRRTPVS